MKINIKKSLFLAAILSLTFYSCETIEFEELRDNPNQLQPDQFSPNLLLNNIQIATGVFFEQVTEEGMELTRILHGFGPDYFSGYGPLQLNGPYSTVYATMLPDVQLLLSQTEEAGLTIHTGMAQVLQAYALMTLVDYLGDIPFEEATQGQGLVIDNPNLSDGALVYDAVEMMLNDAIVNLGTEAPIQPETDLFFPLVGGDIDTAAWIRVANTMLLKLNLQASLVDANAAADINALITGGNLITDISQDFQFTYTTIDQNPDSRHPIFSRNYDNGVTDYQSNSFMDELVNGKPTRDPRTRFYFYRQSAVAGDDTQLSCQNQPPPQQFPAGEAFCIVFGTNGDGAWWGRDHLNAEPIPPDNALRTNWGLYPVGGRFDDDSFEVNTDRNQGALGAGISPIMLSSFVNFMLAESALRLNTQGDPAMLLEAGIRQSIEKVTTLNAEQIAPGFEVTMAEVDAYVGDVMTEYAAATNDTDRLRIIMEEYFIALYGNGVEAYNSYRRTGQPVDLQPALAQDPGIYLRSFFYPTNAVNNNQNINQKPDQTVPVFWDTNPEGFVD